MGILSLLRGNDVPPAEPEPFYERRSDTWPSVITHFANLGGFGAGGVSIDQALRNGAFLDRKSVV
mgnify:FL=1